MASSTLSIPSPQTDDELLDLLEFYLGVKLSRVACCDGHTAPAKAFCDAYFARYPWMVWKAARGVGGKCGDADDLIFLPSGQQARWGDLIGKTFDIFAPGLAGVTTTRASACSNGIEDVYEITLESGHVVRRTAHHKIMSATARRRSGGVIAVENIGWAHCDGVEVGQLALMPDALPTHIDDAPLSDAGVVLTGLLLGDGNTTHAAISLTNTTPDVIEDFRLAVAALGARVVRRGDAYYVQSPEKHYKGPRRQPGRVPAFDIVEKSGMRGCGAATKRVPPRWLLSDRQSRILVGRLWATDGWIQRRFDTSSGYMERNVEFTVISRQLRDDLALIMHRLGVPGYSRDYPASTYRRPDGSRGPAAPTFMWAPFAHALEACCRVLIGVTPGKDRQLREVLESTLKRVGAHRWRTRHAPAGYHWQKIQRVEVIPQRKTVCIHVPAGNLFCGPIVEHNSYMLAALAWMESVTLRASVSVLGGSGAQSKRVQDYVSAFWLKPNAPYEALKGDPTAIKVRMMWGNFIEAQTASQTSVRGAHPQRLRVDEADEVEWKLIDAARGQPMDRDGIISNIVFSSTHQNADGTMTRLMKEAAEQGAPVLEWCIAEGSWVETQLGAVCIERVTTADSVWTRSGWRRVQHVTLMGVKPTVVVITQDGRALRCTADHRIAVDGGWVEAGALTLGTRIIAASAADAMPSSGPDVDVVAGHRVSVSTVAGAVPVQPCTTDILGVCNQFEMVKVDAATITTDVVKLEADRDRTVYLFPEPQMRLARRSSAVAEVEPFHPVAVASATRPLDTRRRDFHAHHSTVVAVQLASAVRVWDIGVEDAHEFVANGIVVHNCWRENMAPAGWLTERAKERYKQTVSAQLWRVEVELGEPSPEGRAIVPECVERMFSLGGVADQYYFDSQSCEQVAITPRKEFRDPEGYYYEFEAPLVGAVYATGADWGSKGDETVIWTWRCDCFPLRLVAYEHLTRRPMPQMIERFMARIRRYPGDAVHDATGVGTYHSDQFTEVADDYLMVGKKRDDLFANFITAIERGECLAPRIISAYHALKYVRNKDIYSAREAQDSGTTKGHPPDALVAGAMAYAAALSARHPLALAGGSSSTPQAPTPGTVGAQTAGSASPLKAAMAFMAKKPKDEVPV